LLDVYELVLRLRLRAGEINNMEPGTSFNQMVDAINADFQAITSGEVSRAQARSLCEQGWKTLWN
jgi:hypothetical protein